MYQSKSIILFTIQKLVYKQILVVPKLELDRVYNCEMTKVYD